MRKILFLIVATILAGQVWAENYDFNFKKLYYRILDQNTVQMVGCWWERDSVSEYKDLVSVVIPEIVTYKKKNYTVVGIDDRAFSNCDLRSISIPNSVKSIGNEAFANCVHLQSISIPNSVKSIGNDAFSNCTSLRKAEFASIESLCQIEFKQKSSNPLFYANSLWINGKLISGEPYRIDLIIPNGVTSIGTLLSVD
jgi:hypothetical protein